MLSKNDGTPSPARPSEIQDILERSTKKPETSTESPMGDAPEKQAGETLVNTSESTTTGNKQILEEIDLVSDDEEEDGDTDVDGGCPVIRLTKEEKVRLRAKWRQSLIVKVMGRNVGYTYLLKRLTAIWHPKARMELVTMENGYYLAKFAFVDDYEFVKYGGPWMVLDHYLIIKEWISNFDPFTDKTESMIVWVRFPCLPVEYFDYNFLMKVGKKIGRPINIDTATSLVSPASFARICVEVDITKPLLSKFTLRRIVRPIVYEGLHLICFKCGVYGHNANGCSKNQNADSNEEQNMNQNGEGRPLATTRCRSEHDGNEKGNESHSREPTLIRPEVTEDYGSWVIVVKPRRKYSKNQESREYRGPVNARNTQHKEGKQMSIVETFNKGSRFQALNEEGNEGQNNTETVEVENTWENQIHENDVSIRDDNVNNQNKSHYSTKGKRPTVLINEKQIEGNNLHGKHKEIPIQTKTTNERCEGRKTGRGRNMAAATEEHIVVHGNKQGATSVLRVQNDFYNEEATIDAQNLLFTEHHGDPPSGINTESTTGHSDHRSGLRDKSSEEMEMEAEA
ncbi:uncharacterized protein LOC116027041 [Ipomoea triloba]|uniref:uncharacterized protein LOC116027041 n=1 Tax=Ipomoea triloba TaxID=35885 RepID=UPI00125D5FAA|nr:uncharacterized protein LOC116027041 [Ipomoea triloba]